MRDELVRLLQSYAAESGRLGQVFADCMGMHATDLAALIAIMQADQRGAALTPGRLGEHLGLSSGATTAVVDRLERAGHVRRARDDRDRRRVTLHHGEPAIAVGVQFFRPLGRRMDEMLTGYSEPELEIVRRFLADTVAMTTDFRRALPKDGGRGTDRAASVQPGGGATAISPPSR